MDTGTYFFEGSSLEGLSVLCGSAPRTGDDFGGWTDEDDARLIMDALSVWRPGLFVDVFKVALEQRSGEFEGMLAGAS